MDGILNLCKPHGITSARALDRVRRITGQRKSGHAGTLDPLAEGVLLVCLGRGTKLVERMMDLPKVYFASARLDVTSTTFDSEAELEPVPIERPPARASLDDALRRMEGTIQQVPPATSALKIRGRPAYQLARAGREVTLRPRPVQVYWTCVHGYAFPNVELEICCGRGTYVRALIRDLGEAVGAGGCLTRLIRVAVGPFRISESWPLPDLAACDPTRAVIPLSEASSMIERTAVPPRPAAPLSQNSHTTFTPA